MAVQPPPPTTEDAPPLPAFVFVWSVDANIAPVSNETLQQQQDNAKLISRTVCSAVSDRPREEFLVNFTGPATTGLLHHEQFKEAVEREDVVVCVWSLFGLGKDSDDLRRFSRALGPYGDKVRLLIWSHDRNSGVVERQGDITVHSSTMARRFEPLAGNGCGYKIRVHGDSNPITTYDSAQVRIYFQWNDWVNLLRDVQLDWLGRSDPFALSDEQLATLRRAVE